MGISGSLASLGVLSNDGVACLTFCFSAASLLINGDVAAVDVPLTDGVLGANGLTNGGVLRSAWVGAVGVGPKEFTSSPFLEVVEEIVGDLGVTTKELGLESLC